MGELRPHLDPSVLPARPVERDETCRRIFNRVVFLRRKMFLSAFDNKHAVFNSGILKPVTCVVLALLVSDEPFFIVPLGLVRQTLIVELVRPDQFPFAGTDADSRHHNQPHHEY